jgi:hypothetical protein
VAADLPDPAAGTAPGRGLFWVVRIVLGLAGIPSTIAIGVPRAIVAVVLFGAGVGCGAVLCWVVVRRRRAVRVPPMLRATVLSDPRAGTRFVGVARVRRSGRVPVGDLG